MGVPQKRAEKMHRKGKSAATTPTQRASRKPALETGCPPVATKSAPHSPSHTLQAASRLSSPKKGCEFQEMSALL